MAGGRPQRGPRRSLTHSLKAVEAALQPAVPQAREPPALHDQGVRDGGPPANLGEASGGFLKRTTDLEMRQGRTSEAQQSASKVTMMKAQPRTDDGECSPPSSTGMDP